MWTSVRPLFPGCWVIARAPTIFNPLNLYLWSLQWIGTLQWYTRYLLWCCNLFRTAILSSRTSRFCSPAGGSS
ncbi:hypothetical protein EJ03DRAFT_82374 [Teratosphaeria nubilosa]|uniref:Uncharacterized protein n=1 Tax=Teratosphaeria nubilosa TaxID=161662 RepID=A0A6G1LBK4_9PEZI|nr:hypothetical protein EJ03DRAFT_82374 [Teratosphaeria nubilosa]